MLSGRLFQAVCPATQIARSSNLVQDDRLGTASLTPDVDADRSVDRLSLMTFGKNSKLNACVIINSRPKVVIRFGIKCSTSMNQWF